MVHSDRGCVAKQAATAFTYCSYFTTKMIFNCFLRQIKADFFEIGCNVTLIPVVLLRCNGLLAHVCALLYVHAIVQYTICTIFRDGYFLIRVLTISRI